MAKQYIDLGFKLGVGGTVTYPRGQKTLNAVVEVGLDNILLETDTPDMPVYGYQGQRNEPARLVNVVGILAEAFYTSPEIISARTNTHFRQLFTQP